MPEPVPPPREWVSWNPCELKVKLLICCCVNCIKEYTPEDSHILQLLFWQHPEQSLPIQLPQCNVPWPSCFLLQTGQTQSCQAWRFDHKDQIEQNPLCLAPNLQELLWEHISHHWPHCSIHQSSQVAVQTLLGIHHWAGFHVHQKWFPRTRKLEQQIRYFLTFHKLRVIKLSANTITTHKKVGRASWKQAWRLENQGSAGTATAVTGFATIRKSKRDLNWDLPWRQSGFRIDLHVTRISEYKNNSQKIAKVN